MTPGLRQPLAPVLEHRHFPHHVDLAISGCARLAIEEIDKARRPVRAGELQVQRGLVGISRLRKAVDNVLRHHQPPVCSQRSTCGRRSQPQNGSSSTKMNGEPNTPRWIAASVSCLRLFLDGRIGDDFQDFLPVMAKGGGNVSRDFRTGNVLVLDHVGAIQRARRFFLPCSRLATPASRSTRAGDWLEIGNLLGIFSSIPIKRAVRTMSWRL